MNTKTLYDIATAPSRYAKTWKNERWAWQRLLERMSQPARTGETVEQYARMSREAQSGIKDVGGFVGGYLKDGQRKTPAVLFRSLATLDIDYGTPDTWQRVKNALPDTACAIYSTHKHTPENPRLRLVIPFARRVNPDEYEPLCRRIAEKIGIELFDHTTYQLPRLFYWPSCSTDGEFIFEQQDGLPLSPDRYLRTYVDFRDASSWPTSENEAARIHRELRHAEDPTEKGGIVGAFCKAYDIETAIDTFLSDIYTPTTTSHRYTYTAGSVAGGLVCYDGKFAFSHHATDPAGGNLCNAFDLVRIHRFAHLDKGHEAAGAATLPSYKEMLDFAASLETVRLIIAKEKLHHAKEDFTDINEEPDHSDNSNHSDNSDHSDHSDDWLKKLDCDRRGNLKSTIRNVELILHNDRRTHARIWKNAFSGDICIKGGLPWRRDATTWVNDDDSHLRKMLETDYGITGKDKITDGLVCEATANARHPVREYLNALRWDGTPRLERLVIDYIGADDNAYNRAATRLHFLAAVKRIFQPGCKYDYCLVLQGAEGVGKSSLFSIMGGDWFSDSLYTIEGKEGMEQLRNAWIIEMAELTGLKKAETESIKKFITSTEDSYRPAYGRTREKHPRQCIFCGTTNEELFLKGDEGNRRFLIIPVDAAKSKKHNFYTALQNDRDQLWAEAVSIYRKNPAAELIMPRELAAEALQRQQNFNVNSDDPMSGLLDSFLEQPLPPDWNTYPLQRRRNFYNNPDPLDAEATQPRVRMCVAEFLCERMKMDLNNADYRLQARKIAKLMNNHPDWECVGTQRQSDFLYGRQKTYQRREEEL